MDHLAPRRGSQNRPSRNKRTRPAIMAPIGDSSAGEIQFRLLVQNANQSIQRDRLGQVMIEAGLPESLRVTGRAAHGDQDRTRQFVEIPRSRRASS
jgi:hypothetical protein